MKAAELVKAGDLSAARAALVESVKGAPSDLARRFELGELLLVQGEWERADTHFDLISTQDPSWGAVVALIRQLIRAEIARREVFQQGRTPEIVGEATEEIALALRVLVEHRAGSEAAVALRSEGDESHAPLGGTLNERPFVGLRDLDDRTADVLEVLTSTGKYYWIPWRMVRSIALQPPKRLRDLVWRAAEVDVTDGPSGVVYIPAIYAPISEGAEDDHRLGRKTDWAEDRGLTCGIGLRCLLVGDDVVPLDEIETLEVS